MGCQWLAELGGVFYSIKEKGFSAREKRVTEHEFNRKMEIESQMAEDKEREDERIAKAAESGSGVLKGPITSAVKRVAKQGAVKRPNTPRMSNRGF